MEVEEGRLSRRPSAEEVIAKLKDDGDFDTLRLKIIQKVKENEELRNSIISEVKQAEIVNQDGSENLKLRQLSDAIYQELGKKIMGQISDEIWKVIRNDSTKEDIRVTVESVYNRIVNPKAKEEDHHSSPIQEDAKESEPQMPPGFAACKDSHEEEIKKLDNDDDDDDMPPGFGIISHGKEDTTSVKVGDGDEMDEDVNIIDTPPGFNNGIKDVAGVGDEDDDELDVPPGFG